MPFPFIVAAAALVVNDGTKNIDIMNKTLSELINDPRVEVNRKGNVLTLKTDSETITVQSNSDIPVSDNAPAESTIISTGVSANITQGRRKPITQMEPIIKQLRTEGKTQLQVAEILGTTQANISKIERTMKKREAEQESQKHTDKTATVDPTP